MTTFRGRRAAAIENPNLRVTVLEEGGHIAEILDKETGINPLWIPPWPSIEPSIFTPAMEAEYGADAEGKLLAGIMGHNLCLDFFGGPSAEEAACGATVHGEGSIAPYEIETRKGSLRMHARLATAEIVFERELELRGRALRIRETVTSLAPYDRPIGWTQHVTIGPPFLENGVTQFRTSATQSRVFEGPFGRDDYLTEGADFDWPRAPRRDGGFADLRVMNGEDSSSAFTTHLMDGARETAFFAAFNPHDRLVFGYVWKRADFPWLGIWEENCSRLQAPWGGNTLARGMEFGVSPIPESRRQMVDRGELFGTPGYRWLPAKGRLKVEYWAMTATADEPPEKMEFPG